MRVRLKLELDCRPDAAWDLLRSPAAFRAVAFPFFVVRPVDGRLPERWSTGAVRVRMRLFGILPLGEQIIDLAFGERRGAQIMTDGGGPVSGSLAVIHEWRHRMAISPSRRGEGTLYRDQLDFRAGALGPVLWPLLWVFWQWRGAGRRRLAARMPGV